MAGRPTRRRAAPTLLALLLAVPLGGCGSASSSSPASAGSGASGHALSTRDLTRIEQCLRRAGLTPSFPTSPPTALPTGGMSGSPKGYPSLGSGTLGDPHVRAALRSCGITHLLPSPGVMNPG
jgi:hypothetical protein